MKPGARIAIRARVANVRTRPISARVLVDIGDAVNDLESAEGVGVPVVIKLHTGMLAC